MHISKLCLRNFRNFWNSTFVFRRGVNTILGENASGKTNAFYAMRLLLDDGLPLRARRLSERDFCWALGDWRGHWIVVSVEFEGLADSEVEQVLVRHGCAHLQGNSSGGSYSLVVRPKHHVRKELFELAAADDGSAFSTRLAQVSFDDYESVELCRGSVDWADDSVYRKYVGDFAARELPDPDEDEFLEELGVRVPSQLSLPREVSCTFVKALRDVVGDMRKPYNNPLTNLLRGAEATIAPESARELSESIARLNTQIGDLEEVRKVAHGIASSLRAAVGLTYAPGLRIESELPEDLERLFRSLTLWASDSLQSRPGKMHELSLGGANLIYLSLRLLEYELKQSADRAAHFLLIEEPEAHIHTHVQKTLFRNISLKQAQVFISTHSTHISDASRISAANVLCRERDETKVYQPSAGLSSKEIGAVERYLDAVRSTLLFAKSVVLVEGEAELILIPTLFHAVFGIHLDEIGVSLISMSSTVFRHVAKIFHEDRVRRRCAIVTDLDSSIFPLGDAVEDDDFQRKCRRAQTAGARRQKELDSLCCDNPWLESFYADHTLEIDFLRAGNLATVEAILAEIYKQDLAIHRSTERLKADDVAVCGREMLRLAEKSGKGWFALLLSTHITWRSQIPGYILQGIGFAAEEQLTDEVCQSILHYRTRQGVEDGDETFKTLAALMEAARADTDAANTLALCRERLPASDPLVRLLEQRES